MQQLPLLLLPLRKDALRALCAVSAAVDVCPSPPPPGQAWLQRPTRLPMERCCIEQAAHVPAVPAGDLRGTALHRDQADAVRALPGFALHRVLELPGGLPLLQRHLRGEAGGGAAVQFHPQPRLPVPGWVLLRDGILHPAFQVSAGLRRGEAG